VTRRSADHAPDAVERREGDPEADRFRNDQVLMSAARFGGQSLFDDPGHVQRPLRRHHRRRMGLKDFSPLDMRKILAGKAAAVSAGLGNYTDVVAGTAGAPTSRPCCRWCG
jgi:hypothetical protein